jgi:hypothetical protein
MVFADTRNSPRDEPGGRTSPRAPANERTNDRYRWIAPTGAYFLAERQKGVNDPRSQVCATSAACGSPRMPATGARARSLGVAAMLC